MTTLTLEIQNESLLASLKNIISSLNGIKIKDDFIENKKYSKVGEDLLEAVGELKEYKKGNIELGNIEDLLK